jgi:UDP-3-O-[3-hydroxymyristoyl] glucosamine N-acyltransferase
MDGVPWTGVPWTLGELARRIGATLRGDPHLVVARVASVARAGAGDLAYLADAGDLDRLRYTRATAVLLGDKEAARCQEAACCPVAALVATDPYLAFAKAAALLQPSPPPPPGRAPTAVVHPSAELHPSVSLGPGAVVESGARIGAAVVVGPGTVVGAGVVVGDYTTLAARIVLLPGTRIGRRCLLHPGVVVGADGFGFAREMGRWVKVPHLGGVEIGDDVEIGANSTIDRGTLEDTVIGPGVKIDNLVQIGHNCRVGRDSAIAGCAGLAGGSRVGERCVVGGGSCISGDVVLGNDVVVLGMTAITKSIPDPGYYSSVFGAMPATEWRRRVARFRRLTRPGGGAEGERE